MGEAPSGASREMNRGGRRRPPRGDVVTWPPPFASFAAFAPAIRPKVIVSEIELPPKRFVPCTPPVTSPAAKSAATGLLSFVSTSVWLSILRQPIV
jgi:hypothetical protein